MRQFLFMLWLVAASLNAAAPQSSSLNETLQQAYAAQNVGDYLKAERLHRTALDLMEEVSGVPESEVARQMSNLSSVLSLLDRPEEALTLLSSAASILLIHPTNDPGQTISLHHNYGRALALLERWSESESHYSTAWELIEDADAADTVYGAENHLGRGYLDWKLGRLVEAEAGYVVAIEMFSDAFGSDSPPLAQFLEQLAQIRAELAVGEP